MRHGSASKLPPKAGGHINHVESGCCEPCRKGSLNGSRCMDRTTTSCVLPQTNMEPEKELFVEDRTVIRALFRLPCCFGRLPHSLFYDSSLEPISVLRGTGDLVSNYT